MRASTDFKLTASLLILALAVGGAGLTFPMLQMLLGLAAVGVGAYFAWTPQARMSSFARMALGLVAAMLLLIVLQLIPLPPFVWQALPGREFVVQLDQALGSSTWRPWTLDVEETIRSLLVLIPAVVMFVGCLRLTTPERMRLPWIVVAFGLIGGILGIVQLATAGGVTPYPSAHLGYPIGLFVNRNHNAALLLVSIPLAAALGTVQIARGRNAATIIALAAIAVLGIVVLATTSRMALILLPIAVVAALLLLFFSGRSLWRIALPSVLGLAGLAVIIVAGGGFNRTLTRFSSLHDARFDYWTDVYWALGHYGIAGTGFGTFIPVYKSAESLGAVGTSILNHAHNEYIELLLEGGVPAILLLVVFFGFMAYCGAKLARSRPKIERASISLAAATGILIFLLFSLVDYPLRMPALSCVFALFCALLLPRVHAPTKRAIVAVEERSGSASASWNAAARPARLAMLAVLAVAAVVIVQAALSSKQLLAQRGTDALRWAPWSTEANEQAGTEALLQGRPQEAFGYASSALKLSPISAPAIRTVAFVQSAGAGNRLMDLAAALGWRDMLTQLWAIDAAKRTGESSKAMERADAVFQQHQFQPGILALIQQPLTPDLLEHIVRTLGHGPEWRSDFLQAGSELPATALGGFEQIVIALGKTDNPPTILEAGPLVDRLIQIGKLDEARAVWTAIHRDSLLLNGDFERVDTGRGPNVPADWSIREEDIQAVDVGRPESGDATRALRLYDTRGSAPIISQRLMLAPGSYVLSFRANERPAAGSVLRWEIRCLQSGADSGSDSTLEKGASWQQFNVDLTVPNLNCPVQRLALKRLGDIHPHELWIDDVGLKQAAR